MKDISHIIKRSALAEDDDRGVGHPIAGKEER